MLRQLHLVCALAVLGSACGSATTTTTTSTTPPPGVGGPDASGSHGEIAKRVAAEPADHSAPLPAKTPIADTYREAADKIIAAATADRDAFTKLAFLTDRIGPRLSGSSALERAVLWAEATMKADGHENVHTEKVMVPHWVRGAESAQMVAPLKRPMAILGLGNSVGTPRGGVTGEVVVVTNFKELKALGSRVNGKIVLFNTPMEKGDPEKGYDDTVKYRYAGPSLAAAQGARAMLQRSLTTHSLSTPHTGTLGYQKGMPKIPAAAVTVEDASLIARLIAGGQTVKVHLTMAARMMKNDKESANVIAELRGTGKPDEIVVIGGHLDSWDVGTGAHDDGSGCVIMMQALTVLRKLDLKPRRTIRLVLFTNEENGGRGSAAYLATHKAEVARHVMALESDSGGFAPQGFTVEGEGPTLGKIKDIVTLLGPIGATRAKQGYGGADITPLVKQGVPGLGLWVEGSKYFDYHHTHADTLDKVDAADLARNVAAVAVLAYIVADMPEPIGK